MANGPRVQAMDPRQMMRPGGGVSMGPAGMPAPSPARQAPPMPSSFGGPSRPPTPGPGGYQGGYNTGRGAPATPPPSQFQRPLVFPRGSSMPPGMQGLVDNMTRQVGAPTAASQAGVQRPMPGMQDAAAGMMRAMGGAGPAGESAAIGGPSMGGPGGLTTPGGPPSTMPPGGPAAPRGAGSTLGVLDNPCGTGGMFDPTASSFNDIESFGRASADRLLGQQLAGVRERFGSSGFGNSGRAALAEGQAIGDAATGLGSAMSTMREGARQNDLGRAMQGILGAGQIDLSRQQFQQQMPLQVLQALSQLGTGLLATGQSEQVPAFLQALMPFLTGFGRSETYGSGRQG